jgi:hypothetical protein
LFIHVGDHLIATGGEEDTQDRRWALLTFLVQRPWFGPLRCPAQSGGHQRRRCHHRHLIVVHAESSRHQHAGRASLPPRCPRGLPSVRLDILLQQWKLALLCHLGSGLAQPRGPWATPAVSEGPLVGRCHVP